MNDSAGSHAFDISAFEELRGAPFFKLCGSGNDFVGFDGRVVPRPSRRAIAAVCDRRFGVGADGVVWLSPADASNRVHLDYWNSDGSDAALCGNGSLCSAVLARTIGIAASDELVLATGAGDVSATVLARDRARIGVGSIAVPRKIDAIRAAEGEESILFTIVGVPHLVVEVDDPQRIDLSRRGRELRFHDALSPAGANVNFVARRAIDEAFALRTYERGVEDETLACGTGSTATGLALMAHGLRGDRVAIATASGEILVVTGRREGDRFEDVCLEGQGRIVFAGRLGA